MLVLPVRPGEWVQVGPARVKAYVQDDGDFRMVFDAPKDVLVLRDRVKRRNETSISEGGDNVQ